MFLFNYTLVIQSQTAINTKQFRKTETYILCPILCSKIPSHPHPPNYQDIDPNWVASWNVSMKDKDDMEAETTICQQYSKLWEPFGLCFNPFLLYFLGVLLSPTPPKFKSSYWWSSTTSQLLCLTIAPNRLSNQKEDRLSFWLEVLDFCLSCLQVYPFHNVITHLSPYQTLYISGHFKILHTEIIPYLSPLFVGRYNVTCSITPNNQSLLVTSSWLNKDPESQNTK